MTEPHRHPLYYYPTPFPICDETWVLERFKIEFLTSRKCPNSHVFYIAEEELNQYCPYCKDGTVAVWYAD